MLFLCEKHASLMSKPQTHFSCLCALIIKEMLDSFVMSVVVLCGGSTATNTGHTRRCLPSANALTRLCESSHIMLASVRLSFRSLGGSVPPLCRSYVSGAWVSPPTSPLIDTTPGLTKITHLLPSHMRTWGRGKYNTNICKIGYGGPHRVSRVEGET